MAPTVGAETLAYLEAVRVDDEVLSLLASSATYRSRFSSGYLLVGGIQIERTTAQKSFF